MAFTWPIWLTALAPWTALAVWLLAGRPPLAEVPSMVLWRGIEAPPARSRKNRLPPPLGVKLLLLASLIAILAAAGPSFRKAAVHGQVVIVVDRGLSMSGGRGLDAAARLRAMLDASATEVSRLVIVPATQDPAATIENASALPAVAVDTSEELRATVLRLLADGERVVALSDRDIGRRDPRLGVVSPSDPLDDPAIVSVSAREATGLQVMTQVRGGLRDVDAILRVESGGASEERSIRLAAGQTQNVFFRLPAAGDVVRVSLKAEGRDDIAANNGFGLVQGGGSAAVRMETRLGEPSMRALEAWRSTRPSSSVGTPEISIAGRPVEPQVPALVLAAVDGSIARVDGRQRVVDHPLTRGIDWTTLPARLGIGPPPPSGWDTLVSEADRTLLAAREQPARQVWVAFDTDAWGATADFVVFWGKTLDWLGEGRGGYVAERPGRIDARWSPMELAPGEGRPGWWPGLYRSADGAVMAVNAAPLETPMPPAAALPLRGDGGAAARWNAAPWLALGSAIAVAAAAWAWPRRVS